MPYFTIEDFRGGLDSRRLAEATPPGSLLKILNAHINRGGEIEKSKAFVKKFVIPPGTFGLSALGLDLYVFGSIADPGMPAGLNYQQCEHESGEDMTEVLDSDVFGNELFVTAEYDNGDRRAFSDGTLVAGFLAGSGTVFEGLQISGACLTYKNKMYLLSGTNMLFSKSGDASVFDESATGSGLIDLSVFVANEADLVGIAAYQNYLAVFSSKNIAIWKTDPDPAAYELIQILPNIGTNAPQSVRSFGDHDLFFGSDTGARSMRAINSSLSAGVSDVGTPIDTIVVDRLSSLSADIIRKSPASIEPKDGRYLWALGDLIFVFSYFASSKISAWSNWAPEVNMTDFALAGGRLYSRAGNDIYLLGGDDNEQYTSQPVKVELPYMDGRSIASFKKWTGIDIVCRGTWRVYMNTDPNNPEVWQEVAVVEKTTTDLEHIGVTQAGPSIKMRLVHEDDGPAVISKIIFHYEQVPDKQK